MPENMLTGLILVISLGVAAQWAAWRLRLPAILVLLLTGLAVGPVAGLVDPRGLFGDLLLPVISVSVAIILFEGGLSLKFSDLRGIGGVVRNLMTVGIVITWALAAGAAWLVLGFSPSLAILLGAILVVTGPTVIVPLLRQIRPSPQVGSIIKWEGIANDPLGAAMAVLAFELILAGGIREGASMLAIKSIGMTLAVGGLAGALAAVFVGLLLWRYWIPDFLHSPVTLMVLLTAYAVANHFKSESGLLAVTVMGLILANQRIVTIRHIAEFKENLRVLLIASVFVLLSASLRPEDLQHLGWRSFVFVALLLVVVRPATVLACTLGSRLDWSQRWFIALIAPRGIVAAAVSSIFALKLQAMNYPQAEELVPITFLVIIGTIAACGLVAGPAAIRLGVADPTAQGLLIFGAHRWARAIGQALRQQGYKVLLVDSAWDKVSAARLEGLEARHGNILARDAVSEIDLADMRRLLALTSNDEANSLAALHFAEVFGRAEVYQLAPHPQRHAAHSHPPAQHLRGRYLFSAEATFSMMEKCFDDGWTVRATALSPQFDYKAYQQRYGKAALPLFVITEDRRISVVTQDARPAPRPGQTIVSLMKEPPAAPAGTPNAL